MDVQVAEAGGEARLAPGFQRLVAEEQHLVFEQGLLDGPLAGVVQRRAEVDAGNDGAQGRADGLDGQAHVVLLVGQVAGAPCAPSLRPSPRG